MLHGPLDTIIGEARLCDVQIPYHHGFRLLYESKAWAFQAYQWRSIRTPVNVPDATFQSASLESEEAMADSVYRDPLRLWKGVSVRDTSFTSILAPHATSSIVRLGLS